MSDVNALTCPNCGGSVDLSDARSEVVKCPYCGTTLQLPEHIHPEPAAPVFQTTYVPPRQVVLPQPVKRRSGAGATVLAIVIVLAVVAGFIASVSSPNGPFSPGYFLWNTVVPMPPAENGAQDLLAEVRVGDEEQIRLIRLDAATRKVTWTTEQSFSSDSSRLQPIPVGDLIYYTDGANLLAFKAADGKLAWQSPLANGVSTSCKGCMRLVDGQMVVLSKDGTLQALDATTGEKTWSTQLNTTPNELLLAGGKPALVDNNNEKNKALFIFDPQTGKSTQLGTNRCSSLAATGKTSAGLEEVYLSPDGKLAYFTFYNYGFNNGPCIMQVDLASSKILWTNGSKSNEIWPSAWFAAQVMISEQGVFFYEDNTLMMIDAATGALHTLLKEPRYRDVTPLISQPGRVVVIAIPDYDSDQKVLWGIDTATGQKAWTYNMQAKSIIDPWRVRLTSAGVVVVQCLRDSKLSQWETLDMTSGASRGLVQLSTTKYDFLDDAWTDNTAYLTIDATLHAVSIKNGVTQYTWP